MTRRFVTRFAALVIISILGMTGMNPASSEEPFKNELDALRQSLSKYQDVYNAVRDGYYSTVGCTHYDGQKMAGHAEYPKGAMGIHFVNTGLVGPNPDPLRPPVLLYEPKNGKLELIGVEWLVPMGIVKERPVLFGQPFLGPMEGHEPLIPKEFTHYDLHAWLFRENPLGMFAPTNSAVNCEGYDFSLLAHPTKLVPAP
jgi:hypothetical protein